MLQKIPKWCVKGWIHSSATSDSTSSGTITSGNLALGAASYGVASSGAAFGDVAALGATSGVFPTSEDL